MVETLLDRINDMLCLNITSDVELDPILACQDKLLRVIQVQSTSHKQFYVTRDRNAFSKSLLMGLLPLCCISKWRKQLLMSIFQFIAFTHCKGKLLSMELEMDTLAVL